jgi:hypothetical protein
MIDHFRTVGTCFFACSISLAVVGSIWANNTQAQSFGSPLASPDSPTVCSGYPGTLGEKQLVTLFNLSFPQSGDAMASLLGSPRQYDRTFDYYLTENSNTWVSVEYQGNSAIAYYVGQH